MRSGILLVLLLASALAFAVDLRAPVSDVRVYDAGWATVTRQGTVDTGTGPVTLTVANFSSSARLDTLSIADPNAQVQEYRYYESGKKVFVTEPVAFHDLLNASMNQMLTLTVTVGSTVSTASGLLVWFDDERAALNVNGKVFVYNLADVRGVALPDNLALVRPVEKTVYETGLRILENVRTKGSRPVKLSYMTPGVSWSPDYKFYLPNEEVVGTGQADAWATVSNNAGEDWNDTRLTLVVGQPRIVSGWISNYARYDYAPAPMYAAAEEAGGAADRFVAAVAGAYYEYSLSEPATLAPGESFTSRMFSEPLRFQREEVWDAGWGGKPERVLKLNNTLSVPWAAGVLRVYENGKFIGEDNLEYTPRGREAEIRYAELSDVTGERAENETTDKVIGAERTTYDVAITLHNGADKDYSITVRDRMNWADKLDLLNSTPTASRQSTYDLEWKVVVPANSDYTISYSYLATYYTGLI